MVHEIRKMIAKWIQSPIITIIPSNQTFKMTPQVLIDEIIQGIRGHSNRPIGTYLLFEAKNEREVIKTSYPSVLGNQVKIVINKIVM
jgi:hypothetical protein